MRLVAVLVLMLSIFLFAVSADKGNYIYQTNESELYTTDSASIARWAYNPHLYNSEEVLQAREFVADSMNVYEDDEVEVKLEKISSFLIQRFHKQLGAPEENLRIYTPWQQFNLLSKDTSRDLYCTHYSAMYSFFARISGMSIREIECKGKNDLHIFNEVFVPASDKWVYSDLTQGVVWMEENKKPLSAVDVFHAVTKTNLSANILSPLLLDDSVLVRNKIWKQLAYNFDKDCALYFYQHSNLDLVPNSLFSQHEPVALVFSEKAIYYKWPTLKVVALFFGVISLMFIFRDWSRLIALGKNKQ